MIYWIIDYVDGTTAKQFSGVDPNNPPKTAKSISLVNDATGDKLSIPIPCNALPAYAKERRLIGISGNKFMDSIVMIGYSTNGVRTLKCYSVKENRWVNKQDNLGWQSRVC